MTFLTAFFAFAALGAVSIPILLHLLMKGRPKKQVFPALAFLREKHKRNKRRFTLKHLLLLALRCLAILLLGLALARPSLKSPDDASGGGRIRRALGSRSAPIAAAFVFDTSARMEYTLFNRTRLDEAKTFARDLIARLPAESQIAVLSPSGEHDLFQVDRLAALEQIDRLHADAPRRSLAETAAAAVRLLSDAELDDRELFLLTDRSAAGWPAAGKRELAAALQEERLSRKADRPEIAVHLTDFAASPLQDTAIVGLERTPDADRQRSAGRLELELAHIGSAKDGTLELWLLDPPKGTKSPDENTSKSGTEKASESGTETTAGNETKKSAESGTESAKIDPTQYPGARRLKTEPFSFPEEAVESRKRVTLSLDEPADGFRVGFVRLVPGDALEADNVRWFAFDARSGGRILLVAPDSAPDAPLFVREALAPESFRQAGFTPFEPESVEQSAFGRLTPEELQKYQAIFFLDPAPMDEKNWQKIGDYVSSGGGAGFFLGRRAVPVEQFAASGAATLLGGVPRTQVRRPEGESYLIPVDYENPVLAAFRPLIGSGRIPWRDLPVLRHWKFDPLDETSETVLRFPNGDPALWTRRHGLGSIAVAATPFSDAPNDVKAWNRLAAGESAWVFLVLVDGVAKSLTGGGGEILQYEPGQIVRLRPKAVDFPASIVLELPDRETVAVPTEPEKREIRFSGTGQIGPYRIEPTPDASGATLSGGFCVNWPASEFRLEAISPEVLTSYWDGLSLQTTRTAEEVEFGRHGRRVGREIFPLAAILLLLVVVAESALSNRFYD